MAAVITYGSSRITITGAYKQFTGTSTTTVVTFSSGEAPASGDSGRFILWCKDGTTNTGPWEIRRITAATSTTVTVHDPWTATPSSGDTFRISSTADDILAAQPTAGTKTGTTTFAFSGDLQLASTAFFGSADESLEWTRAGDAICFPLASNTALQLGQAWGGEGAATETTNGSRWSVVITTSAPTVSLFSGLNGRDAAGAVMNFYGSLIESRIPSPGWAFQRMRGPSRFIGCVFDGPMGGRFYHERSEWVSCRMSGNNNITPAWSIGATFDRAIISVAFFRNTYAMKSFENFGGTLRNLTLSNNTFVFNRDGLASSVFLFIDSTEFVQSETGNAGGLVRQFRSITFTTTDSTGAALSGVAVRVNNKNDTTQSAVSVSSGSGAVSEILALRFEQVHGSATMTGFAPFRIRIRQYGKFWASLQAEVADPIKQSYAMIVDPNVSQASGTAAAHTGITLTDHGGSPVAWNGKNWGITITGNTSVNPSLTLADIKHYLHWHLAQNAAIGGKASGLHWHNMLPMSGTETQNGTYGLTMTKGVRVVNQGGDPFPGVTRMQADDGTYYVPPVTYTLTLTGLISGSEVRAYTGTDPATASELTATESSGTSFPINHSGGSVAGFIVIRKTDYKFLKINVSYDSASSSIPVSQQADPWYANPP